MSMLTSAGITRVNQETARLAQTNRERELAQYREGDRTYAAMSNFSAMTRITEERKSQTVNTPTPTKEPTKLAQPRRAPAKEQLSPGSTKLRKTELTRLGA